MTEVLIERSSLLIQHKRFKEAEMQLMEVLKTDPENTTALSLLSICKSETGDHPGALALIKQVIGKQPDDHYSLYLHALYSLRNDNPKEAEKFIRSAISYNPQRADYFGLLATIKLQQKEWQQALDYANQGLASDAENLTCLNTRSTALTKLERHEESFETIREALNKDPENDTTHTNVGWSLLERGDTENALESFRQALKFNPENQYAKAGLVEGLKARYWFYRMFLKYAFWVSNLKAKGQWFFVIGMYVGVRILRVVSTMDPILALVLTPIIYLYFAFALSTWLIEPLSNLFLRLNVYGRYALTEDQIKSSNFTGIALLSGALSGIAYLVMGGELLFMTMIFGFLMMIPLASMFSPAKPGKKRILILYAAALGVVGALSIVLYALNIDSFSLWMMFLIGVIAYQWVVNAILIR